MLNRLSNFLLRALSLIVLFLGSILAQTLFPLEAATLENLQDKEKEEFDIEIEQTENQYPYLLNYVVKKNEGWCAFFQDGSAWILDDCRDDNFLDILSQWHPGDEIRLYPRHHAKKKKGSWFLKNLSNNTVFYGRMRTPPKVGLQITYIDTKGYFLELAPDFCQY